MNCFPLFVWEQRLQRRQCIIMLVLRNWFCVCCGTHVNQLYILSPGRRRGRCPAGPVAGGGMSDYVSKWKENWMVGWTQMINTDILKLCPGKLSGCKMTVYSQSWVIAQPCCPSFFTARTQPRPDKTRLYTFLVNCASSTDCKLSVMFAACRLRCQGTDGQSAKLLINCIAPSLDHCLMGPQHHSWQLRHLATRFFFKGSAFVTDYSR